MYTPAFDPFNGIYRMLLILQHFDTEEEVEVDRLRIFDFYLLFPYKTAKITMRSEEKEMKELRNKFIRSKETPYNYNLNDRKLFERLRPYQMIALSHLASYGLIDPERLLQQKVRILNPELMHDVVSQLDAMSDDERNTLSWLSHSFRTTPLGGKYGLKSRTHLIESKYDGN